MKNKPIAYCCICLKPIYKEIDMVIEENIFAMFGLKHCKPCWRLRQQMKQRIITGKSI